MQPRPLCQSYGRQGVPQIGPGAPIFTARMLNLVILNSNGRGAETVVVVFACLWPSLFCVLSYLSMIVSSAEFYSTTAMPLEPRPENPRQPPREGHMGRVLRSVEGWKSAYGRNLPSLGPLSVGHSSQRNGLPDQATNARNSPWRSTVVDVIGLPWEVDPPFLRPTSAEPDSHCRQPGKPVGVPLLVMPTPPIILPSIGDVF